MVRYLLAVSRAQEAGFRGKAARPERSMIEEQAFCVFFWAHESGTRLLRRSTKVTIYVSVMIIMRLEWIYDSPEGNRAFFDWAEPEESEESEGEAHSLAQAVGHEVRHSTKLVKANYGGSAPGKSVVDRVGGAALAVDCSSTGD